LRAEPAQDAVALGRGDEDLRVRDIGYRLDDRQDAVKLPHADLAVDGSDTVLSGLLGPLECRDRAAEQKQRLGHIPLRGLETPLVPVAGFGEQGAHVLFEHGKRRVCEPGLNVGNLGHENGGPPGRFEINDVLHGHDGALVD
jgi:hypothetical protein